MRIPTFSLNNSCQYAASVNRDSLYSEIKNLQSNLYPSPSGMLPALQRALQLLFIPNPLFFQKSEIEHVSNFFIHNKVISDISFFLSLDVSSDNFVHCCCAVGFAHKWNGIVVTRSIFLNVVKKTIYLFNTDIF
jgi:hypothetical protein